MSNYRAGDIFDNRYLIQEHIGSGGFAEVFKATDNMTNTTVAIKMYNSLDKHGVEIFRKEYQKVSDLHHQRLLKAQHFSVFEGSPYLILPFCKEGSLTRLLVEEDHLLSEKQIAGILFQVAEGLEYLHENNIIHQDIKPDNILELKEGKYVLSDFGISQRIRSTMAKSTRRTQKMDDVSSGYTTQYAPPEAERLSRRPSPSKDVFSLGVTLYELTTKDLPFNDTGKAIEKKMSLPPLPEQYSSGLYQLIKNCLDLDPESRPTATQLKEAAQHFLTKGVWSLPNKKRPHSIPIPRTQPRAATIKKQKNEDKKRWLALLAIPAIALLGWGIFEMMGETQIKTTPPPITENKKEEPPNATENKPEEKQASPALAKEDTSQKEYDKLIASAERKFKRSEYERSLATFRKAKGKVKNDKRARDGIEKCNDKITEINQNRREQENREAEAPPKSKEPETSNNIFEVVEEMPSFSGCSGISNEDQRKKCSDRKMLEFIFSKIAYPTLARENGIEGTVLITFVVEKDGNLSSFKIVRDVSGGCGEEALRMAKQMPKWSPGKSKGRPVRVQFNLPVKFRLSD